MQKGFASLLSAFTAVSFLAVTAVTVSGQEPFYNGKTVRIIVGFSPGGGYDALARMLSRHMPKYIPGRPTIIVENMTGAASLLAANHVFNVAKPDGLTFGHFSGGFAYSQVLGQPGVEFDVRKFVFVGAAARDESAVALTKASGITNMDRWFAAKTPVKLGTTGPGAFGTDNVIKIIKAALNLPIQIISGYKGTADMRLAAESGEIDGTTWGWDSMRGTWQKAIESGAVNIVLQTVPKAFADLPQVPLAIDFAKTAEAKQLIEFGIHYPSKITKTLALPPGTPSDRAQILQRALQQTVKDPEFMAEAEKAKIGLAPVTAEEMRKTVEGIFNLDPPVLAKFKTILFQ
jgi:tripartite-type tricarboxylate transporter receptor subunit TctC